MKSDFKELLITFLILSTFSITGKAQLSTVLVDMEPLVDTHGEVVKSLQRYIQLEEERLEKLKRFTEEYDKLHKSAIKNVDNFLSNPVNAYLLVKRLTIDWNYVLNLVEDATNTDVVHNLTKEEIFPSYDDLDEASNAIIRLQDTYLLNPALLTKGEVAGIKGSSELTASDCFELGLNAYYEYKYNCSILWLQETLDRLDEDEFEMVNKSVLLDHMAYVTFWLGNVQHAKKLILDLIQIDPDHPFARQNLKIYDEKIRKDKNKKIDIDKEEELKESKNEMNMNQTNNFDKDEFDEESYKKLCRGEHLRSPAEESKLFCRYTTSNSKYFLLQPVKEETLSLDPWIVMYHDVIRDRDIELLKEIAGPSLGRATVIDAETGALEFAKYRVSKSGWLVDAAHPRVAHISFLIEEITGLETDSAEPLQINKYGLGGQYDTHYDFSMPDDFDSFAVFGIGNRISTWLFYLSDVDAGGSTVFPDLGVQVKPIKGSAAFWYNLFKNGAGDLRTKHAACPVITGTKWVANKWLHERNQEFRRPCSLNPLE